MAVTLSLFAGAGAQFFDNNGNVLSGGKIYTYSAGTTTPLAVYTSNSESVFHTNPIILDAAGRVPSGGEIWLQLGVGYKFVLRTSTDVLIATYDNIPSSAQPPAANDADSIMYEQGYTVTAGSFVVGKIYRIVSVGTTDFTLIGATSNTVGTHFIATGVGTGTGTAELSQTVETKLRQTVSVKDFGAVGDGITDDTMAVTNAIMHANLIGGSEIVFPAGNYVLLSVPVLSNVVINATGATITKKSTSTHYQHIFEAKGTVTATVTSLTANATLPATSVSVASTVGFAPGQIVVLYDNTYEYGSNGRNQELLRVKSVGASSITFYGSIIGNYTTTNGAAIAVVNGPQNCHFVGGTYVIANGTKGGGITFEYVYNGSVRGADISGMDFYAGVQVVSSALIEVDSNYIHDGQNNAVGGDQGDPVIVAASSHGVNITNNRFENFCQVTVTNGSKFVVIANNYAKGAYDSAFNTHGTGNYNVVIANNTIVGSQQYGIAVGYSSHFAGDRNIVINGNTINQTYSSSISVGAKVGEENDNIVITNNTCTNSGIVGTGKAGIGVNSSKNVVIANNTVKDNYNATSIQAVLLVDAVVEGNSINISRSGYGCEMNNCTNTTFVGNTASNIDSYNYRSVGTNINCAFIDNVADDDLVNIGSAVAQQNNSWQSYGAQAGQITIACDGSGYIFRGNVTFPRVFKSSPYVVATAYDQVGNWATMVLNITTTGCTLTIVDTEKALRTGNVTVYWMAMQPT